MLSLLQKQMRLTEIIEQDSMTYHLTTKKQQNTYENINKN